MFLIPGSVLAATALLPTPGMQPTLNTKKVSICHQMCLQIMAEDKDPNQGLVKAG